MTTTGLLAVRSMISTGLLAVAGMPSTGLLCCGAGMTTTDLLAVVGAHLTGQPLNDQLIRRGAELVETTRTDAAYRLYALATDPPKPGLVRVSEGGSAIEVELWRLTAAAFGDFLWQVPQPMMIGQVELADGRLVTGLGVEPVALTDAPDISAYGGWRAWLAARHPPNLSEVSALPQEHVPQRTHE